MHVLFPVPPDVRVQAPEWPSPFVQSLLCEYVPTFERVWWKRGTDPVGFDTLSLVEQDIEGLACVCVRVAFHQEAVLTVCW